VVNDFSKFKFFLNLGMMTLLVFGLYISLSLFEVWAYLPFWLKNISLAGSLVAVYIYARRALKNPENSDRKISPALGIGTLAVLGAVTFGILQAGPALPGRLIQAFTFSLDQPPNEVLLTLEVIPPSHTGLSKTTLFSVENGPVSRLDLENPVPFPEGSIVTLKLQMDETITPVISLGNEWAKATKDGENIYTAQQVLKESSTLDIQVGPYIAISQKFEVIPDENPTIEFVNLPTPTARKSIKIRANFEDDFGVEEIYLELSSTGTEPTLTRLPFLKGRGKTGSSTFFINLLADPRAGTQVRGKLVAFDALGQKAESEGLTFSLPEKVLQNPLAKEILEIRKVLLLSPARQTSQIRRLSDLTENPATFADKKGLYLALRSAYWRLRSAENQKDLDEITRFLWQTSLSLEDDGSYEEQGLRTLLEEMTEMALTGEDIRGFEKVAVSLRAKGNELFRLEFRQTRRRFSFNSGVEGFEIPQIRNFRELTEILEREATENNRENVLRVLLEARSLFEEMGSLKGRRRPPGG